MSDWKQCPRCQRATLLNETRCAACGHVFRTQFAPVDRTQQVPAVAPPAATTDHSRYAPPSGGPMDAAEWQLSCFWLWTGIYFTLGAALATVQQWCWTPVLAVGGLMVLPLLACLGAATTYFMLRTRRLYIYYGAGKSPSVPAILLTILIALQLAGQAFANVSVREQTARDEAAAQKAEQAEQAQQAADDAAQKRQDAEDAAARRNAPSLAGMMSGMYRQPATPYPPGSTYSR